ncbi:hypothetical protein AGMMS49573_07810 [Endomicrobiia bacterium]|nr:hypothetical protein AGMMS49573_07810 [Endomicrobiia bacterium]
MPQTYIPVRRPKNWQSPNPAPEGLSPQQIIEWQNGQWDDYVRTQLQPYAQEAVEEENAPYEEWGVDKVAKTVFGVLGFLSTVAGGDARMKDAPVSPTTKMQQAEVTSNLTSLGRNIKNILGGGDTDQYADEDILLPNGKLVPKGSLLPKKKNLIDQWEFGQNKSFYDRTAKKWLHEGVGKLKEIANDYEINEKSIFVKGARALAPLASSIGGALKKTFARSGVSRFGAALLQGAKRAEESIPQNVKEGIKEGTKFVAAAAPVVMGAYGSFKGIKGHFDAKKEAHNQALINDMIKGATEMRDKRELNEAADHTENLAKEFAKEHGHYPEVESANADERFLAQNMQAVRKFRNPESVDNSPAEQFTMAGDTSGNKYSAKHLTQLEAGLRSDIKEGSETAYQKQNEENLGKYGEGGLLDKRWVDEYKKSGTNEPFTAFIHKKEITYEKNIKKAQDVGITVGKDAVIGALTPPFGAAGAIRGATQSVIRQTIRAVAEHYNSSEGLTNILTTAADFASGKIFSPAQITQMAANGMKEKAIQALENGVRQTIISMTEQAAENVKTGKPLFENMGAAATTGAIGAVGNQAAAEIGKSVTSFVQKDSQNLIRAAISGATGSISRDVASGAVGAGQQAITNIFNGKPAGTDVQAQINPAGMTINALQSGKQAYTAQKKENKRIAQLPTVEQYHQEAVDPLTLAGAGIYNQQPMTGADVANQFEMQDAMQDSTADERLRQMQSEGLVREEQQRRIDAATADTNRAYENLQNRFISQVTAAREKGEQSAFDQSIEGRRTTVNTKISQLMEELRGVNDQLRQSRNKGQLSFNPAAMKSTLSPDENTALMHKAAELRKELKAQNQELDKIKTEEFNAKSRAEMQINPNPDRTSLGYVKGQYKEAADTGKDIASNIKDIVLDAADVGTFGLATKVTGQQEHINEFREQRPDLHALSEAVSLNLNPVGAVNKAIKPVVKVVKEALPFTEAAKSKKVLNIINTESKKIQKSIDSRIGRPTVLPSGEKVSNIRQKETMAGFGDIEAALAAKSEKKATGTQWSRMLPFLGAANTEISQQGNDEQYDQQQPIDMSDRPEYNPPESGTEINPPELNTQPDMPEPSKGLNIDVPEYTADIPPEPPPPAFESWSGKTEKYRRDWYPSDDETDAPSFNLPQVEQGLNVPPMTYGKGTGTGQGQGSGDSNELAVGAVAQHRGGAERGDGGKDSRTKEDLRASMNARLADLVSAAGGDEDTLKDIEHLQQYSPSELEHNLQQSKATIWKPAGLNMPQYQWDKEVQEYYKWRDEQTRDWDKKTEEERKKINAETDRWNLAHNIPIGDEGKTHPFRQHLYQRQAQRIRELQALEENKKSTPDFLARFNAKKEEAMRKRTNALSLRARRKRRRGQSEIEALRARVAQLERQNQQPPEEEDLTLDAPAPQDLTDTTQQPKADEEAQAQAEISPEILTKGIAEPIPEESNATVKQVLADSLPVRDIGSPQQEEAELGDILPAEAFINSLQLPAEPDKETLETITQQNPQLITKKQQYIKPEEATAMTVKQPPAELNTMGWGRVLPTEESFEDSMPIDMLDTTPMVPKPDNQPLEGEEAPQPDIIATKQAYLKPAEATAEEAAMAEQPPQFNRIIVPNEEEAVLEALQPQDITDTGAFDENQNPLADKVSSALPVVPPELLNPQQLPYLEYLENQDIPLDGGLYARGEEPYDPVTTDRFVQAPMPPELEGKMPQKQWNFLAKFYIYRRTELARDRYRAEKNHDWKTADQLTEELSALNRKFADDYDIKEFIKKDASEEKKSFGRRWDDWQRQLTFAYSDELSEREGERQYVQEALQQAPQAEPYNATVKGIVPQRADAMMPRDFEATPVELGIKGYIEPPLQKLNRILENPNDTQQPKTFKDLNQILQKQKAAQPAQDNSPQVSQFQFNKPPQNFEDLHQMLQQPKAVQPDIKQSGSDNKDTDLFEQPEFKLKEDWENLPPEELNFLIAPEMERVPTKEEQPEEQPQEEQQDDIPDEEVPIDANTSQFLFRRPLMQHEYEEWQEKQPEALKETFAQHYDYYLKANRKFNAEVWFNKPDDRYIAPAGKRPSPRVTRELQREEGRHEEPVKMLKAGEQPAEDDRPNQYGFANANPNAEEGSGGFAGGGGSGKYDPHYLPIPNYAYDPEMLNYQRGGMPLDDYTADQIPQNSDYEGVPFAEEIAGVTPQAQAHPDEQQPLPEQPAGQPLTEMPSFMPAQQAGATPQVQGQQQQQSKIPLQPAATSTKFTEPQKIDFSGGFSPAPQGTGLYPAQQALQQPTSTPDMGFTRQNEGVYYMPNTAFGMKPTQQSSGGGFAGGGGYGGGSSGGTLNVVGQPQQNYQQPQQQQGWGNTVGNIIGGLGQAGQMLSGGLNMANGVMNLVSTGKGFIEDMFGITEQRRKDQLAEQEAQRQKVRQEAAQDRAQMTKEEQADQQRRAEAQQYSMSNSRGTVEWVTDPDGTRRQVTKLDDYGQAQKDAAAAAMGKLGDSNQYAQDAADAVMNQYDRRTQEANEERMRKLEESLVNQGLRPDSAAYRAAMKREQDAQADARQNAFDQSISQGYQYGQQGYRDQLATWQALNQFQDPSELYKEMAGANAYSQSSVLPAWQYGASREDAYNNYNNSAAQAAQQGAQFAQSMHNSQQQMGTAYLQQQAASANQNMYNQQNTYNQNMFTASRDMYNNYNNQQQYQQDLINGRIDANQNYVNQQNLAMQQNQYEQDRRIYQEEWNREMMKENKPGFMQQFASGLGQGMNFLNQGLQAFGSYSASKMAQERYLRAQGQQNSY